jgi:hypothetical protein
MGLRAPTGQQHHHRDQPCSGDGGGRRRTEEMQRGARKVTGGTSEGCGSLEGRSTWRVELHPVSMADVLGTGVPHG